MICMMEIKYKICRTQEINTMHLTSCVVFCACFVFLCLDTTLFSWVLKNSSTFEVQPKGIKNSKIGMNHTKLQVFVATRFWVGWRSQWLAFFRYVSITDWRRYLLSKHARIEALTGSLCRSLQWCIPGNPPDQMFEFCTDVWPRMPQIGSQSVTDTYFLLLTRHTKLNTKRIAHRCNRALLKPSLENVKQNGIKHRRKSTWIIRSLCSTSAV